MNVLLNSGAIWSIGMYMDAKQVVQQDMENSKKFDSKGVVKAQ